MMQRRSVQPFLTDAASYPSQEVNDSRRHSLRVHAKYSSSTPRRRCHNVEHQSWTSWIYRVVFLSTLVLIPANYWYRQRDVKNRKPEISTVAYNHSLTTGGSKQRAITLEQARQISQETNDVVIPHTYTQHDIIRLVRRRRPFMWWHWHVLIYNQNIHKDETNTHLFQLFALYKSPPADSLGVDWDCHYCHDFVPLLVDGIQNYWASQRPISRQATGSERIMLPYPSLQLLLAVGPDYISEPCSHDDDIDIDGSVSRTQTSNISSCLVDGQHPPFITIASIPKTAKAPGVVADSNSLGIAFQYPTRHYNYCLFRWRQQQRDRQHHDNSPLDLCGLKRHVMELSRRQSSHVWTTLIPQLFWTGSNYQFLKERKEFHHLKWCGSVLPHRRGNLTVAQVADILLRHSHEINPRCLALALSLQAQAASVPAINHVSSTTSSNLSIATSRLPWIDIKFTSDWRESYRARGYDFIVRLNYTTPMDMSKYKYQIDLGGEGGTTWLGTITKLAMPGLLFHHETPAKDWFYDEIQPWVHYVPINTNLSNLYDMFVWAESNPDEARRIAQQGQSYARRHVSEAYMAETFDRMFVQQLGNIALAYRPMTNNHMNDDKEDGEETIESILRSYNESGISFQLVATCNETHYDLKGQK